MRSFFAFSVFAAFAYGIRLFLAQFGVVFTNTQFALLFALAALCGLYRRLRYHSN